MIKSNIFGAILVASTLAACSSLKTDDRAENSQLLSCVQDLNVGEFYTYTEELPSSPGVVLRSEPLKKHQSLKRAGENIRLLYTSTDGVDGRDRIAVSGALYLPKGTPPEGGWPLLAWAHGTVGVADNCAPSYFGRQQRDQTYLDLWLANGFAIVASDYQGLGTPGHHPYLWTRPAAYSTLDIIRAVTTGDYPLSDKVVIIGQSQGAGATVGTLAFAKDYAPDVEIIGGVATGVPYFSAEGLAAIQETRPKDIVDPLLAYNFFALSTVHLIDPDFSMRDYVADEVMPIIEALDNTCYRQVYDRVAEEKVTYNKAFKQSPTEPLVKAFKRMGYADLNFDAPIFVGAGGKDISTPIRMQKAFVQNACAAGSKIEAHYYPHGTHGSIVNGSTNDSMKFIKAVFAGEEIQSNCDALPFDK